MEGREIGGFMVFIVWIYLLLIPVCLYDQEVKNALRGKKDSKKSHMGFNLDILYLNLNCSIKILLFI